jgi:hypothetical protein
MQAQFMQIALFDESGSRDVESVIRDDGSPFDNDVIQLLSPLTRDNVSRM